MTVEGSATGLKKPPTFDHLKKKQPLQRTIQIPLDEDVNERYEAASQAVADAQLTDGKPPAELQAELEAATEALRESTITLKFRSIGRKAYDALLLDWPITEEQKKELEAEGEAPPSWNTEEFPVHLIAASCVEPAMTPDQVRELSEEWNSVEFAALWVAALEVNTLRRVVDLGKD